MSKKVFIRTFGCQMNEYDSDKMADVLHAAQGYEPTTNVDEAVRRRGLDLRPGHPDLGQAVRHPRSAPGGPPLPFSSAS